MALKLDQHPTTKNWRIVDDVTGRVQHVGSDSEQRKGEINYRGQKFSFTPRGTEISMDLAAATASAPEKTFMQKLKAGQYSGELGGIGGGLLGLSLAGPIGGFVGGTLGAAGTTATHELAQALQEGKFDKPDLRPTVSQEIMSDALWAAGKDAALGMLGEGIFQVGAKGLPQAYKWAGKKLSPWAKQIEPEVVSFLKKNPDFPISLGQLTESNLAKLMESIFSHNRKLNMVGEQQKILEGILKNQVPELGPEAIAQVVKEQIVEGKIVKANDIAKIYRRARAMAGGNRFVYQKQVPTGQYQMQPIGPGGQSIPVVGPGGQMVPIMKTVNVTVRGPIELVRAKKAAGEVLKSIGDLSKVPEDMRASVAKLQEIAGSEDIISFKDALTHKRVTGAAGFRGQLPNVDEATFQKLNRAIEDDIKHSIGNPKFKYKDPTGLYGTYRHGNDSNSVYHDLYDTPEINSLLNTTATGKESIRGVLKDGNTIQRALDASKDPVKTRAHLKSEYLNDLIERYDMLKGDKAKQSLLLDSFKDRENEHIRTMLFDSKERHSLNELFTVFKKLDPSVPMTGVIPMLIYRARAALGGPISMLGTMGAGFTMGQLTAAGLGGGIAVGKHLTNKVLMNPEMAKAVVNLQKVPPESAAYKRSLRILTQGLKISDLVFEEEED